MAQTVKRAFASSGASLVLLVAVVILPAATRGAAATAPAAAGTEETPLQLFAKLMPVFTHSRCENCHGALNPFTGATHPGGVIRANFDYTTEDMGMRNASCLAAGCHTTSPDWRLAPRHLAFVNKDTKQLCKQQAEQVRARTPAGYLGHLNGDILVDLAFEGYSGGASQVAAPPDMSKRDFLAAAKAWLQDGGALCNGWAGFIRQTETFDTHYQYPIQAGTGPSSTTVSTSAKRVVTIKLEDGVATAELEASGHQTITTVIHDIGTNGPCSSTLISNDDWVGSNQGEALVRVKITAEGDYTIRFTGPEETTRGSNNGHTTTDCGPLPLSPDDSVPNELVWPAWSYTIYSHLPNPRDRRELAGNKTKTVMPDGSDAAEPQSWLAVSPVGVARADDGKPLPITVNTFWAFRAVE
jgi:hypothetical protein